MESHNHRAFSRHNHSRPVFLLHNQGALISGHMGFHIVSVNVSECTDCFLISSIHHTHFSSVAGNNKKCRNYNFYIIIGQPTSSSARVSLVVPKSQLTTTATTYQLADETNYYTFNLSYSGSTVTLAYKGRSSSGQILRVFGVN